jgi:prevent-host-death family protein
MKPMTARDLKNSTGEVVRTLRRGGRILLTFRGRPIGTITPVEGGGTPAQAVRSYNDAWAAIDAELQGSQPRFASWRDAEDDSRGRR